MSLPQQIRSRLTLPAVCAPMFLVTTPELVREACLAGVIGGLPRQNARSIEEFEAWLVMISEALKRRRDEQPDSRLAPIAVNLASNMSPADFDANLSLCHRYGVEIIINATGNPTELARRAHDRGMLVWADAVSMRFAEKAMSVGAEGIVAIGAGGGGHSGVVSHLALVAAIRERFDGTLIMAGAVSTGAAIRAAEILGADRHGFLGEAHTDGVGPDQHAAVMGALGELGRVAGGVDDDLDAIALAKAEVGVEVGRAHVGGQVHRQRREAGVRLFVASPFDRFVDHLQPALELLDRAGVLARQAADHARKASLAH